MFIIKKNQIIITTLVIMISIAGYLNYSDKKVSDNSRMVFKDEIANKDLQEYAKAEDQKTKDNETKTTNATNTTQDATNTAQDVNTTSKDKTKNQEKTTSDSSSIEATTQTAQSDSEDIGSAVFVNNSMDESFFLQAKMNREQTREQRKEWLTDMLNNKNLDETKRKDASDEILQIQQRIEKENAAESLIESKGFEGVYVRIDDDTVDVVVSKESLTPKEVAQIQDIVKRKTGVSIEKIKINPLKKAD